jgi:hypothetical protein
VLDQIVICVVRYRKGAWLTGVEEWVKADKEVGSELDHSLRRWFLVEVDRSLIVKADWARHWVRRDASNVGTRQCRGRCCIGTRSSNCGLSRPLEVPQAIV